MENYGESNFPTETKSALPLRLGLVFYPLMIAVIVAGLDQFSKWLVVTNLRFGESVPAEGFARITYLVNFGSAFGLFRNSGDILTWVGLIVAAVLLVSSTITKSFSNIVRAAFGLMLGGAAGNLIDRIRMGFVVDFIDIGPWPVFNLADSAITTGAIIIGIYLLFSRDRIRQNRPDIDAGLPTQENISQSTGTGTQGKGEVSSLHSLGETLLTDGLDTKEDSKNESNGKHA